MKKAQVSLLACLFCLLSLSGLSAQNFAVEGSGYRAAGEGFAKDEAAALNAARSEALRSLLGGLGKDGLFAEILVREPPASLSFATASLLPENGGFRARVELRVDDESLRIIERGPYLQAALALLNEAERALGEAGALVPAAEEAENALRLGESLGRYGQVLDRTEAGLGLLGPLEASSIYSSQGGRSLLDLRAALAALRERATRGLARIREAESLLARDAASRNLGSAVEAALAEVGRAEALLEEERPLLSDPTAAPAERLLPLLDRLSLERSALEDLSSALERAGETLKPGPGYLADKLDFARRRLASSGKALETAYKAVQRELRDPAARRAARAKALRYVFLHQSRDIYQARAYLPFAIEADEGGFSARESFEGRLRLEGALGETGGAWIRIGLERGAPALYPGAEPALSQDLDFGFWRRSLLWFGYGWDWLPKLQGRGRAGLGELRLGLGGVSSRGRENPRLDWLVGLSYELPGELPETFDEAFSWAYLNGGLEALFRLGNFAVLEGELFAREREAGPGTRYLLGGYRLGLGLRLPPPFLLGAELRGEKNWVLDEDWERQGEAIGEELGFRFYLEYDL